MRAIKKCGLALVILLCVQIVGISFTFGANKQVHINQDTKSISVNVVNALIPEVIINGGTKISLGSGSVEQGYVDNNGDSPI